MRQRHKYLLHVCSISFQNPGFDFSGAKLDGRYENREVNAMARAAKEDKC